MSGQPLRTAIYVRVSGTEQLASYSPDGQERRCREYVAARGWTLEERHVYREAWSGAYLGRAKLEDLRDAIKRRELDRVVVYHSDRWGRDPEHRIFLTVEAGIHGCKYVSVEDDRPDTDEGRLLQYVSGWSAGNERRNIGRRGQASLRDRVASGKRLVGAKPPFGYRWSSEVDAKGKPIKGGLEVYEPEAVVVRRIFRELAAGASLRSVAEGLNRHRVPTPNPARVKPGNVPTWYIRTVHLLLDNPVYIGRSVAYRQVAELRDEYTGRRVPRVKPESEWVEVLGSTVPALVDQATWEAAQARRAVNRERSRRSKTAHTDVLLSLGVARCAYCDAALHVNRTKGGRVRYRCGHQQPKPGCRAEGRAFGSCVEAHLLDRDVWAAVEAVLNNPALIRSRLRDQAGDDGAARDLAVCDAHLAELAAQEANLTDAIAKVTSAATIEALVKRLDRLTEERQGVLRRWADAQLREWAHQAALQQADDVTAWAAQERATLAGLDYHGKRQRLDRLRVRVHVYRPDDEARRVLGRFDLAIAPPGVTPRDLNLGEAERLGLGLGTTAHTSAPGTRTRRSRRWTRTTWNGAWS